MTPERESCGSAFSNLLDEHFALPPHFDERLRFEYVKDDFSGVVRRTCRLAESPTSSSGSNDTNDAQALADALAAAEGSVTPVLDNDEAESMAFVADAYDVFCVGPCSSARWRTYIDCSKWDPHSHHDELLMDRAYHAKVLYETSCLLEVCNKEWVSRPTIEHLRIAAMLNLRACEIHLASFQLTSQQVGFRRDPDLLYKTAILAHTVHLHVFDMFCDLGRIKRGRGTAMAERPSATDTPQTLAQCIDTNLHAIHMFMKIGRTAFLAAESADAPQQAKKLAQMLTMLIRTLDQILYVIV